MKLDRPLAERFYALYCKPFSPDLTVPKSVSEIGFPWKRLEQQEKITAKPQQVVDWRFAQSPRLIIERDLIPPALKDEPQTPTD